MPVVTTHPNTPGTLTIDSATISCTHELKWPKIVLPSVLAVLVYLVYHLLRRDMKLESNQPPDGLVAQYA